MDGSENSGTKSEENYSKGIKSSSRRFFFCQPKVVSRVKVVLCYIMQAEKVYENLEKAFPDRNRLSETFST